MRHRISNSESEESYPALRCRSLLLDKIQGAVEVPDLPIGQHDKVYGLVSSNYVESSIQDRQKAGSTHIRVEYARDIGQRILKGFAPSTAFDLSQSFSYLLPKHHDVEMTVSRKTFEELHRRLQRVDLLTHRPDRSATKMISRLETELWFCSMKLGGMVSIKALWLGKEGWVSIQREWLFQGSLRTSENIEDEVPPLNPS